MTANHFQRGFSEKFRSCPYYICAINVLDDFVLCYEKNVLALVVVFLGSNVS